MPSTGRTEEEVRQAIGAHFEVVPGSQPVEVQCRICAHEGSRPFQFRPRVLEGHKNTQKHQRNLRSIPHLQGAEHTSTGPAENQLEDVDKLQEDGVSNETENPWADADAPSWFGWENEQAFWELAEERDDVMLGLQEEMLQIRREDQEMMGVLGPAVEGMVGQETGSWGPFKERRIFVALAFLLSPRHCHHLATLELALKMAQALGAPRVPTIDVC
ncbi:hypothetical protein A4X09_0g7470 [Tilletia walkeri]|uniref:Uncharacterized protein n=1 Tax=Tilletia walkeri TaxID=117179 RepID=A0A8X7N3F7_9BASI|nr:hypothetical protein A4X09_0g7470 [Tilletia walkeri]